MKNFALPEWMTKERVLTVLTGIYVFVLAFLSIRRLAPSVPLQYAGIAVNIVLVLTMAVFYFALVKWKWEKEKLYLVLGFGFGLAMLIILPIYVVPDEPFHIFKAYAISNKILGTGDNPNYVLYMRASDNAYAGTTAYRQDILEYYYNMFTWKLEDPTVIETWRPIMGSAEYQYFASAIGISIGRLLGLNTVFTYLLGRLLNLIFFVCIIALAIKIIPFGKMAVFVLGLMPMSLQQGMSFSYDSWVICICALIVAWDMRIAYSEETGTKIAKWEYLLLAYLNYLIIDVKQHAYILVPIFSLMFILKRKGYIKKVFWKILWGCIGAGVLAFLAYVVWKTWIHPADLVEVPYGTVAWDGSLQAYTIQHFINDPLELVRVYARALIGNADWYIESYIGCALGWFDIIVDPKIIYTFVPQIVYAALRRKEEKQFITIGDAGLMGGTFFLTMFAIMFGMLLHWTAVAYGVIDGVQGRYLIPVGLLLTLLFRPKKIEVKPEWDRIQIWTLAVTLFGVFQYIMYFDMLG